MIPNFSSTISGLTLASVTLTNKEHVSLKNRLLSNIITANKYWYYIYIALFIPLAVLFGLGVKEQVDYGNLLPYHQKYNNLTNQLTMANSVIKRLDAFIDRFASLSTESVHYHLIEKRILETKKPSIYQNITLNPERSHVIIKTSSFLDGAIFQRDFKSYEGVYLPLYSTEYWKRL